MNPDPHQHRATIAIIGGGFSGAMTAYHLLKLSNPNTPFRLVLIERRGVAGQGIAYSTPHDLHLLNVPASRMSALPEKPDDFYVWAKARVGDVSEYSFLSRNLYGQYVNELLGKVATESPHIDFEFLIDEVVAIRKEKLSSTDSTVELGSGNQFVAQVVVLAMGHGQSKKIPGLASDTIDAWDYEGLKRVKSKDKVLLLGTGLTMMDVALLLKQELREVSLMALSRRGLVPHIHPHAPLAPLEGGEAEKLANLPFGKLIGEVRRMTKSKGIQWFQIVDSLRPHTSAIWKRLTLSQKRSFVIHLAPYWEVHRHRCAPEIGSAINKLISYSSLKVVAARVVKIERTGERIAVHFRPRGSVNSHVETEHVDKIVNCLGPESDVAKWTHPLMRQLLSDGFFVPDQLKLGLSGDGIGPGGIFFMGTFRKAELWESTAVPELRKQAEEVAEMILRALN